MAIGVQRPSLGVPRQTLVTSRDTSDGTGHAFPLHDQALRRLRTHDFRPCPGCLFVRLYDVLANSRPSVVSGVLKLMRVAHAACDPARFDTIVQTAVNVLGYNVLGTNDAAGRLHGNPHDNMAGIRVRAATCS